MEKRIFNVGDRVQNWDGVKGTVIRVRTITSEMSSAPHHRLEMIADSGQAINRCEGAEYNFSHINRYFVYEGPICRAAQVTLEGAQRYMTPDRVLIDDFEHKLV